MYTQCPRCGAMLADPGRDFPCPRCGAPVRSAGGGFVADEDAMGPLASVHMSAEPGWKALPRALQQLARLGAFALFWVALALCFIALFVGIPLVLGEAPESDLQAAFFILTPAPLAIVLFSGPALAAYHIFLSVAIIASLAYLIYGERRKLFPLLSESAARFRSPDRRSALGVVQLPQVFLAIFFFDIIFALILAFTNTTTRAPAFETYPEWYLYFTFASASVYEELAARTMLLGVPMMLAYMLAYLRRPPPALGPAGAWPPAGAPMAPAPPQPAAPPKLAAPQKPRPDPLVDGTVGDPSTRLVPKPADKQVPVASTPAFVAPAPKAPPVQGPGLLFPRLPEKDQALIPAPTRRPVIEITEVDRGSASSRRFERLISGEATMMVDTAVPGPLPAAVPPPREPRPAAPPPGYRPPPTLNDYLRSRTTNGLWGYILGGGFKIGPLEAFFIVGSALMFGLAHVAGWDLWKALPTFVAGLGFGYLFLKVGIHASILLHFAFDYLSLGEGLLPGAGYMDVLLVVLFTIVGAFYLGHYTVLAAKWFRAQIRPAEGTAESR